MRIPKEIEELKENAGNAKRAEVAKRAKLEKKHAQEFNQCKCKNFVPKPQTECDTCLLAKYGLYDHIKHDSLDHLGMEDLIPADEVVKVLRQLEK